MEFISYRQKLIHCVRLMKMKEKQPRSVLATWSLTASLLGPILTVLGILCLMLVSSLSRAARHDLAWVELIFRNVAIPSLLLSPPFALVLSFLALAGIKQAEGAIRGKVLARCAIVISVLTLCFLVWAVPTFRAVQNRSEANACGGNMRMLDSAKEQWAMSVGVTNGPVDLVGVLSYIKGNRMPLCPSGGEYTLDDIGETPQCSLHCTISNRYYPKWWE